MKKRQIGLLLLTAALAAAAGAQAQTASVTKGDIEKTVFGTGAVQPVRQPGVYAEITADVSQILVGLGDTVSAGDVLIQMENETLADEAAQLEYDIQLVQEDVQATKTHTQYAYKAVLDEDGRPRYDVNTGEPLMQKYSNEITVRAPCDGRIMAVYIEPGDDALAVFREKGAVVMLSTDGCMKVELQEITGAALTLGQTVRVTGEGIETTGRVKNLSRHGTSAEILVQSDEFPMDAPVRVSTQDGQTVGEGILEINRPIGISAYGGTIKGLPYNIGVGKYVKRYDVIARIEWEEIPLYLDNDAALREYTKKKIELDNAWEKMEALTVVAPCDGQIASIDVKAGDSVEDGTKLLSIVETDAGLSLILSVDELDIVHVQPGQKVEIAVDAIPDISLAGVVEKIAPLGNTQQSVTTYDVYVTLTGDIDSRIKGGMNVSGEITVDSAQDALIIPTEALRKGEDGWYVTLSSGETAEVETGIMTDGQTQILSGLYEGETVVY